MPLACSPKVAARAAFDIDRLQEKTTAMSGIHVNDAGLCRFVEVLTSDPEGIAYGYRMVGGGRGPQLVVAGQGPAAEQVFDRLMSIPTLPWMRGALTLVRMDLMVQCRGGLDALGAAGPVDRTVVLPWFGAGALSERDLRESVHLVLRVSTGMGMITGRGVARA